MTPLPRQGDPLEELHFALEEGGAERPPHRLGQTVLESALAARSAGRPVGEPPPISPVEAFRRAVTAVDEVLTSLAPAEWRRPALRGLDVQHLVGHLTGVERDFHTGLTAPEGVHGDDDHVTATDPTVAAQSGRTPAETYDEWREAAAETLGALRDVEGSSAVIGAVVPLHGLHMPLGQLLVVRTFELWTHEEDIRRATGRALQPPDAASLRLMTDLAVAMLPGVMGGAERSGEGRVARIVLTGAGGGTWQMHLGSSPHAPSPEGSVDVRIVLDAVDFCRLVANRVDPAALAAVVTGDPVLATDLFVGAASLALD